MKMLLSRHYGLARIWKSVKTRSISSDVTIQIPKCSLHNLTEEEGPSIEAKVTKMEAIEYYRQMSIIRKMEASTNAMYKAKIIRGFCHLYSGQEAVAVGIKAVLIPKDAALTSYRCHAWCYLMHGSLFEIFAELTGTSMGCSRGKGGSMHMYGDNFYGGNAIVGAQVPLGVGVALAMKYKNTKNLCVILYGDGAALNGQVAEAMNIAKLLNLPALFVCENNLYGMGTSVPRATSYGKFYKMGYSIPGIKVNGQDILAVREAARCATNYIRSDKGPIILETETYRYSGHSLSDPGTTYRTRDEVEHVRKTRDPIITFKNKMIENKLVTEAEFKKIDDEAKKLVNEETAKAKKGKEIPVEELTYDIYGSEVIKEVRNINPFKPLIHKSTGHAANLK